MDRLIVNGVDVDLYDKDQAGINLGVNNLGDLTDRDGGYSQTLKVPKTDKNLATFGYSHSLVSNSEDVYTKLECQYYSGGVQLIGQGYAVVNDVGVDFNLTLFSGNTSLFSKIEGLKLSDLDLSDYDLIWDFDGVASMYGNTASPMTLLLDNGNVEYNSREIETSEMYFHLFFSTILDQIFIDAGFEKDGAIFSELDYTQMIFPFVNEYPKQGLVEIEESMTKAVNTTTEILTPAPTGTFSDVDLTFADDSVRGYDVNDNYDTVTGVYTAPHLGRVKIKSHLVIYVNDMIGGVTGTLVYIKIMVNGVQVTTSETLLHEQALNNDNNYLDFELEVDVNAGDEIQLTAVTYNPIGHPVGYFVGIVTGDDSTNGRSYFQFDLDDELLWGGMWRANRNLPDMAQKDFLKMFCQIFGQSFETDEFSAMVSFFNIDEVIARKGLDESFDYSDYFDVGSENIKYHSTYAKINECKFAKDDNVTEFYGDGSFAIGDETLKEKMTAIQLPVASSLTVSRMLGIEMGQLLRFDIDGKEVTPKPRILKRVSTPLTSTNYIRLVEDGTANVQDFFSSITGLFLYDFNYLLSTYYVGWIEVLNDYKLVGCNVLVPSSKVQQFTFKYPVYIARLSSWFYVNKIENYKNGKLCKLELQRI